MGVVIAVTAERRGAETRVAITPETVKKFIALGASLQIETGAGLASSFPDSAYAEAGAQIKPDLKATLAGANILLKVRAPAEDEMSALAPGTIVIGQLDPHREKDRIKALAAASATSFAMEFVPRITRAQVMDVLSSQANLAGYRAVIEAASAYGKAFPMMMTAAGTVAAAKVFVMGAGVAGLQAIATARRLGAVVTATDVRPAAKEQVESLGAKFIAVEDDEFKQAETSGGYAKEMSDAYKAKQAELVSNHIAKQDVVITTALIPGRPAPKLVSEAQALSMKPGSVIVDLAVEQGGNCELSRAGEIYQHSSGIVLVGLANLPGRVPADASSLYARNLYAFLGLLLTKEGHVEVNLEDEILKASCLTHAGALVHPGVQ